MHVYPHLNYDNTSRRWRETKINLLDRENIVSPALARASPELALVMRKESDCLWPWRRILIASDREEEPWFTRRTVPLSHLETTVHYTLALRGNRGPWLWGEKRNSFTLERKTWLVHTENHDSFLPRENHDSVMLRKGRKSSISEKSAWVIHTERGSSFRHTA